jgi:hypothetical protein
MNNELKYNVGRIYFAIFGVIVLGFGAAELLLGTTGGSFEWGPLEMSGEFLLWQGIILFSAGAFYLSSLKNFLDIHQQAKTLMASIMIWIVAGMQIFGMILESIPGGEDGWFNTAEGFLGAYAGPYIPELLLLPFSLVVMYYVRSIKRPSS